MDEELNGSDKEGGDAPLIDLNEASIKKLIARAKRNLRPVGMVLRRSGLSVPYLSIASR